MKKQRPFAGVLAATGGVLALVVCLAAIDEDIRAQVTQVLHGGAPTQKAAVVTDARELGFVIVQAVHDQTIEHAPLVIFAFAATVLVLFMLRT
jgi:hypothetical protein